MKMPKVKKMKKMAPKMARAKKSGGKKSAKPKMGKGGKMPFGKKMGNAPKMPKNAVKKMRKKKGM
jgi:hypothetical protein